MACQRAGVNGPDADPARSSRQGSSRNPLGQARSASSATNGRRQSGAANGGAQ